MADEEKQTEDVDKREIIREVMAIAARPDEDFEGGEEEKIETIAKKLEEMYNPSEAGNGDETPEEEKKEGEDEDCEDEDDEPKDKTEDDGEEPEIKQEGEDEEPDKSCDKDDEEDKPVSMDAAIKYLARKDSLIKRLRPVIGDNYQFPQMTIKQVVKYACDKLDIKNSEDALNGYLKAKSRASVKVSMDSAFSAPQKSETIKQYLK